MTMRSIKPWQQGVQGWTLGSAKSWRRVSKNNKIILKIEEVGTTTLGSTQDDDEKYKCSVFGSVAFMWTARKLIKSSR
jgi:hypothetical protein